MAQTFTNPRDFPQVWERPSFRDLLACLKSLRVEPPVWDPTAPKNVTRQQQENTARYRSEVASYLSGIVSSGLKWIEDDGEKEIIWEEAGRCLSERCGRAGMGKVTRTWPFHRREPPFELVVREPPITGDSLGHKTWGSSYLMAQLLDDVASGPLAHLLPESPHAPVSVLELGSGTGLLGMAAAAVWRTEVVLSDLPDIMANLDYNVEKNRATVERLGGQLSSGTLTWGSREGNDAIFSLKNRFNIILSADGIYDDNHPDLLSSAIHEHLANGADSRAIVMVPIRDQITKRLIMQFQSKMRTGSLALVVIEEHTITGQDDWGDDDESQTVECWWAVFGRSPI
ncbi:putative methyltransferase-domain-containing protein [Xylariaceae sp. FL0594]|nr:putative methyltransferase-domain-containing protein [Xylariaceae sp. FL0594]